MKIKMYDPPSGWQFGFPKQYKPQNQEALRETLIRDGYPREEADFASHHTFFWEEEIVINNKLGPIPEPDLELTGLLAGVANSRHPFLQIRVKRLTPTAKLPTKAYQNDSGFDLYADTHYPIQRGFESWIIGDRRVRTIPTGIAIELPKGYGGILKARSSQGVNGNDILGGVIDNGYRGEIRVSVYSSQSMLSIRPGEKLCQMIVVPVPECQIEEVKELSESERGTSGFGSTGK